MIKYCFIVNFAMFWLNMTLYAVGEHHLTTLGVALFNLAVGTVTLRMFISGAFS